MKRITIKLLSLKIWEATNENGEDQLTADNEQWSMNYINKKDYV